MLSILLILLLLPCPVAADETAPAEESIVAEEGAAAENSAVAEETAVAEGSAAAEDAAATEETSATENTAGAEETADAKERVVLTIGDLATRSGNRYDENLGLWQYLAELVGVEIRYVYLSTEEYAAGLASGDLPDIVATDKNLSMILENGVALDADPYLEEYCPNFFRGDTRLTYDVFKQLGGEGSGFYFFPAKIGYNGVGYSNETSARGYVVRWDYYRELGYTPINNV